MRRSRLAQKLRQIRLTLGLTQQEMLDRLGDTRTRLYRGHIGEYETGKRQPPMLVLLQYARVAGVPMEMLVDDEIDLPERLPGMPEYERMMKRVRTES
jgi:transcriptional regulator with XRE-family HTH domain